MTGHQSDVSSAATYSIRIRASDMPDVATAENGKRARIEKALGRRIPDADWIYWRDIDDSEIEWIIPAAPEAQPMDAAAALAVYNAMCHYTAADLEWADRCGFAVACDLLPTVGPRDTDTDRITKLVEAARQYPTVEPEQFAHIDDRTLNAMLSAAATPAKSADVNLTPAYGNVAALLDGTMPEPPIPALLTRDDGRAVLYRGELNVLEGDPEDGKTWVALAAVVEEINAGGKALFVDMDHNGLHAIVGRLVALGANTDHMRSTQHFRHIEPDSADELDQVIADCASWQPGIAVYDCVGELMSVYGGNNDNADEYTAIVNRAVMPLVKAGAAAVLIDHLAKGKDSRAYGSGGTMAKRRKLGGVAVRVQPIEKLTRGRGGRLRLIGRKDRHSGIRSHCPPMPAGGFNIGDFVILEDAETGRMEAVVRAPGDALIPLASGACGPIRDSDREYLQAAEDLSAAKPDGFTLVDLVKTVDDVIEVSTAQRNSARHAVNRLTTSGYLQCVHAGGRGASGPARYTVAEAD